MEGMHASDVEQALTAVEIYLLECGDFVLFQDVLWEITRVIEHGNVNNLEFELCEAQINAEGVAEPKELAEVRYVLARTMVGRAY